MERVKGLLILNLRQADAEKTLEEKQGTEIDGRSISLYYTGEKGQSQDHRGGKNSTWSGESKTLVLSNLSYSATEETFRKFLRRQLISRCPRTKMANLKGMHL